MHTPERSGPVTFGQLSVLRSWELYVRLGDEPVANLYYEWGVPAGASIAQVTQAWNSLLRAHESLRTTYPSGTGRPTQDVHQWRLVAPLLIEGDDDPSTTVNMAAPTRRHVRGMTASSSECSMAVSVPGRPTRDFAFPES